MRHAFSYRAGLAFNVEACTLVGCQVLRHSAGDGHHTYRLATDPPEWRWRKMPPCMGTAAPKLPRVRKPRPSRAKAVHP